MVYWCELPKHKQPMQMWFDEDSQEFWFCPDCTTVPGYGQEKIEMPSCLVCGRPYDELQGICQDCGGEAEIFARSFTDPGLIIELCEHCAKIFVDYGTWEIIGHE